MSKRYFRYPTILKDSNRYHICVNTGNYHNGITKLYTLDYNNDLLEKKIIDDSTFYMTHNFTLFLSSDNELVYGLGGLIRNQHPFLPKFKNREASQNRRKKKKLRKQIFERSGVYLLSTSDYVNWKKYEQPIFSINNIPKSNIDTGGRIQKTKVDGNTKLKKYEDKAPEFDANLCCFYSKILNKYILFIRSNLYRGCRSVQVSTSSDLINWSEFKKMLIPNFVEFPQKNNLYMFKCIELYEKNVFLAVTVFTDKNNNPTQMYLKKLLSYDSINWIDCGKLCDISIHSDALHANTHVAEILYDSQLKKLDIFLHEKCFEIDSYISKYTFDLDFEKDIVNEYSNLYLKKENEQIFFKFNLCDD